MEKRITFRCKGWLLDLLLKEKDVSKVIREALKVHYGEVKK